jgi:cytoskeletal protein RodZ
MSIFEPPGPPEPPDSEPVPPDSEPVPPDGEPGAGEALPPVGTAAESAAQSEFSEFFHTADLPERPARSHRGAIETSPFMQKLLAPVTAVIVVVVVILLLIWINGGSSGTQQSPAAVGPGAHTSAPPAGTSHSPRPTHSSRGRTASPRPSRSTSATATPTQSAHRTKHATPAVTTAMAPVIVLNNSRRTGLAAAVAAELRSRKWSVAGVGNQTHVLPVTTLYYSPGQHAAAVHLRREFSSVQRIAPNRSAGIVGPGLTLVVTQSWVL